MQKRTIAHFLIGIPGSGKSTFAARLAKLGNYRIVSTDAIRLQLYGNACIQGEWEAIAQKVLSEIREAIASGQSIIYDATNVKREWRADFLNAVNSLEGCDRLVWIAWYLNVPLEVAKARNRLRDRVVPDGVIDSMFQFLQEFPPEVAEGFAAVNEVNAEREINWSEIEEKIHL